MGEMSILGSILKIFESSDINKISLLLVLAAMALIWFMMKDKKRNTELIQKLEKSILSLAKTIDINRISEEYLEDRDSERLALLTKEMEKILDELKEFRSQLRSTTEYCKGRSRGRQSNEQRHSSDD